MRRFSWLRCLLWVWRPCVMWPRLRTEGTGLYEGPLHLQTGGTWQVTVTVQRDGRTIASETTERQRYGRHVMITRID